VQAFPNTQFVVTGVLGPHSNAHGPNEFLHLGMAKQLTACVGELVSRLFERDLNTWLAEATMP